MDPSKTQPVIEHPLRFSGDFWGARFFGDDSELSQKTLVSTLTTIAHLPRDIEALSGWFLGERRPSGIDFWSLLPTKEGVRFSNAWLDAVPADLTGDLDSPFLWRNGDLGMVVAGTSDASLASGLRVNGFRLEDLSYSGAGAAFGFEASEYVVIPSEGVPFQDFPFDLEIAGMTLTLPPSAISSETGNPRLFELIRHDTWFVPCKGDPAFLLTSRGVLTRGNGFRKVGEWMILFDDPEVLWPDRAVTAFGQDNLGDSPFASAAKVDLARGACRQVMTYLRSDQSTAQFERALAEIAGERILEDDDQVLKIYRQGDGYQYWLKDQGHLWLPGPPCYATGSTVPGGRGHRIRVRSYRKDGRFWEHPRWKKNGISSHAIWPHLPEFRMTNRTDTLIWQDGVPQVLSDDPQAVEAWQRIATDQTLADLTSVGPGSPRQEVNLLDLVFTELRDRLLAIETDLHLWSPARWQLVRCWAERERPVGAVLVPGWTT